MANTTARPNWGADDRCSVELMPIAVTRPIAASTLRSPGPAPSEAMLRGMGDEQALKILKTNVVEQQRRTSRQEIRHQGPKLKLSAKGRQEPAVGYVRHR